MALATIIQSSSDGQVSMPDRAGPTGQLYTTPNSNQILRYPSNLGDNQHTHMIMFTALVNKPSDYDEAKSYAIKMASSPDSGAGFNVSGQDNIDEQTDLTFQPKRYRSTDIVALYMPDTISFGYAASYSTTSLTAAMKEIAEGAGKVLDGGKGIVSEGVKAFSSVLESNAAKLAFSSQGLAANPQNQLLFDNIDFRQYQLSFTFTPKNAAESATVYNIIKLFRFHAAPRISTGITGMMFEVPDSFLVQFISGQNGNKFITRVKESVLMNVDVNYAPNGIWSTHADGSPTQITMNLTFKEIVLVDKTAIENGF